MKLEKFYMIWKWKEIEVKRSPLEGYGAHRKDGWRVQSWSYQTCTSPLVNLEKSLFLFYGGKYNKNIMYKWSKCIIKYMQLGTIDAYRQLIE